MALVTTLSGPRGHAAGMPVSSSGLSTFRPTDLPPVCVTETIYADLDTYVAESSKNSSYGGTSPLIVQARGGNNARALVRFALPAPPAGCTLGGATLRLFNTPTAGSAGRPISVFGAGGAWSGTTNWNTQPATPTGTAVNDTAASGWMTWAVKTHVDAMYAGSNHGFSVRDASEGGGTIYAQQFTSAESATNKPELILQWQ